MSELRGVVGLLAILGVAFVVSNNRSRIPWRTVVVGLAAARLGLKALLAGSLVNLANAAIAGVVAS